MQRDEGAIQSGVWGEICREFNISLLAVAKFKDYLEKDKMNADEITSQILDRLSMLKEKKAYSFHGVQAKDLDDKILLCCCADYPNFIDFALPLADYHKVLLLAIDANSIQVAKKLLEMLPSLDESCRKKIQQNGNLELIALMHSKPKEMKLATSIKHILWSSSHSPSSFHSSDSGEERGETRPAGEHKSVRC